METLTYQKPFLKGTVFSFSDDLDSDFTNDIIGEVEEGEEILISNFEKYSPKVISLYLKDKNRISIRLEEELGTYIELTDCGIVYETEEID